MVKDWETLGTLMRTKETPPLIVFLVLWHLDGCQNFKDWGTDKDTQENFRKSREFSFSWPEYSLLERSHSGQKKKSSLSDWSNVATSYIYF